MKSGKNTIKRGGAVTNSYSMGGWVSDYSRLINDLVNSNIEFSYNNENDNITASHKVDQKKQGGSKRKSRKSRKVKKTKKGRGAYEGGKKKCPKHCRRKTSHTRKGLKHHKN